MRDPIKTTLFRRHGFLAGSVLAVALHGHALSQEAPDQRGGSLALMEEITVTAQKREENIQSVPISMQALTGNMIEKLDLKRANEVERLVPNLDARMAADTQINYSIRGVGENNFHTNSVGAVGLYLDEVTLSSPISTALQLFDMERIEVLRGPQNTLFGLNTTGGAVNFITRKPEVGGDPNGRVRATYGRFNQMDVEGAVGLPLGETAAIRVAGAVQSRNGWQRNLTRDEKAHEIERYAGRVQLAFEPGERLEILLNVHGALNRGDNRHYKSIGTQDPADPGQPCPLIGGPINVGDSCVDGGGFQDNDDFREYFGDMGPLRNDIDNYGAIASLQWHFDTFSLSSITAYISNELERHEDADASPNAFFGFHQFADVEQFSQEVRLTSTADADLRWIAGSIYFEEDSFYSTSVRRAPAGILPGAWPPGNFTIMPTTQVDQKNRNWSLYGQAEYDVTNDLKITGGLRWVRETKTGVNNAFVGSGGGLDPNLYIGPDEALINTPLQTLPPLAFDFTWKEWGGKLGVDYHVSDDLMVYASVARGFKGGGISVAALQALVGQAAREVRPETLLTYEAGFKATLDDKRLTFNGAVFWNDWKNQQMFAVIPVQGELLPLLVNIPKSRIIGAEFDVQWSPGDGWFFMGGLGLLDSSVRDPGDLVFVGQGNELRYTPTVNFNLLARKEFDLSFGLLAVQADYRYFGKHNHDIENKPEFIEGGYGVLNARAGLSFGPDDAYEFAVWGRNLTGETFCAARTDMRGIADSILCLPNEAYRAYGVELSARF